MPVNSEIGAVRTSTDAFGSDNPGRSNVKYHGVEWRSTRNPDYHVYVYNLSRRTFKGVGRIGLTIPGVDDDDSTKVFDPKTDRVQNGKDNEKWHYVTSFPQPVLISKFDDQAGMIGYTETDVIRFIIDQIQPDNLTRSLDTVIRPENTWAPGTNYVERGVFFSLKNPPLKEDVQKAVKRMEDYYNRLLEQAATLELTDKVKLSEQLAGNPDYAYAADYFGKEVSWRKKQQRPEECANCGESKPAGRKFHVTSFGSLCIEQSMEGWKSAVNSGVKKRDDVPPEYIWWAAATPTEKPKLSTSEK